MLQKKILAVAVSWGILSSVAFAASFQSYEQSAVMMGQGNAGTTVTTDPSIQYYNPAGMAFVDQTEMGLSGILVHSDIDFTPTQATGFDGRNITGSTKGPGTENYIPGFYFIKPVNQKLSFGIGTEVPFGLETSYPETSIARYFAVESLITSININPSIAYKIDPRFSIGGGLIGNYTSANLSQIVDGQGILQFPSFLAQPGDVISDNKANGWALGWDAGVEFKPTDATALGLAYHSQINQSSLQGNEKLSSSSLYSLQQLFTLAGIQNASLSSSLTLPGYATLSASHEMTSKWTVMSDIEYINWSALKSITLNYVGNCPNSSAMPSQTILFNYRDTWRFAVGQSYQIRPDLLLRMGLAYDETPITSDTLRNARLPDNNRYWVTMGATYDINNRSDISFGYAHVFIQNSVSENSLGLQTFNANYSGNANLVGLQYNLKFS